MGAGFDREVEECVRSSDGPKQTAKSQKKIIVTIILKINYTYCPIEKESFLLENNCYCFTGGKLT